MLFYFSGLVLWDADKNSRFTLQIVFLRPLNEPDLPVYCGFQPLKSLFKLVFTNQAGVLKGKAWNIISER